MKRTWAHKLAILTLLFMSFSLRVLAESPYTLDFQTNGGSAVSDLPSEILSMGSPVAFNLSFASGSFAVDEALIADLNNDHSDDLLVYIQGDHSLAYVDSLGEHVIANTLTDSYLFQAADLDGDTDIDLICIDSSFNHLTWFENVAGDFSTVHSLDTLTDHPLQTATDVELVDWNRDGLLDVVVVSSASQQILYYENLGGSFATATVLVDSISAEQIVVADLDLDGDLDFVFYNSLSEDLSWLENQEAQWITHSIDTSLPNVMNMTWLDATAEGDDALWVQTSTEILSFPFVEDDFQASVSLLSINAIGKVQMTDMDGDLDPDLIVTTVDEVAIYLNDGAGAIRPLKMTSQALTNPAFSIVDGNDIVSFPQNGDDPTRAALSVTSYVVDTPSTTTKNDYIFAGWYLEEQLSTPAVFPFDLTSDTTLYAKWTPKLYTIDYVLNGGINDMANPNQFSIEDSPLFLQEPIREGYVFEGWYLSEDFSGNSISILSSGEEVLSDVTLYASWSVAHHWLVFEGMNGEEIQADSYLFGADLSLLDFPIAPQIEGYTFSSWSELIPNTMPDHDVTITANYTPNSYTISFDSLGGNEVADQEVLYLDDIPAVLVQKEGFDFLGWSEDGINPIAYTTMPAHDLSLKALWETHHFSITWDLSQGSAPILPETFTILSSGSLPIPTREGYDFLGFYISPAFVGDTITDYGFLPLEDVTLYARWAVQVYTLSIYGWDHELIAAYPIAFGESLADFELPIASPPTGYLFSMWDQNLPDTMPAEPLSITASFMPMVFTITWEGSELSSTQLAYGSPIELPSITKEGYDFEGWYLDSSFDTRVDLTTMPAQDLTFYASWLVHYHELYYYIFENRYDMGSIAYGTHPHIPTHVFPDKDFLGYTWNGEFIDGQNFLMPDEEVTLYAVYLDDVAPIVSGVENREHYPSGTSLIITFDEGTATLNGEEFLSGTEVSESGIYTLIVTDAALNQTEVTFVIETTVLPTILISSATTVALGAIWIFRKQILKVLIRK